MEEEDEGGGGDIPEWVVTFGDMMSLLLTFFIMLVSLSEMKEEETYQAMVQSMQQNFGYDMSQLSITPGDARPRNSKVAKLATTGRSRRRDTMKGGAKPQAASGENERVLNVRMGDRTGIGTVVRFQQHQAELSDEARKSIDELIVLLSGKPQKIDVRGHTSKVPIPDSDPWTLSFARANVVTQYMLANGIKQHRVRISVAGKGEPLSITVGDKTEATDIQENDRVEIFMLDESSDLTIGKPGEQDKQLIEE